MKIKITKEQFNRILKEEIEKFVSNMPDHVLDLNELADIPEGDSNFKGVEQDETTVTENAEVPAEDAPVVDEKCEVKPKETKKVKK